MTFKLCISYQVRSWTTGPSHHGDSHSWQTCFGLQLNLLVYCKLFVCANNYIKQCLRNMPLYRTTFISLLLSDFLALVMNCGGGQYKYLVVVSDFSFAYPQLSDTCSARFIKGWEQCFVSFQWWERVSQEKILQICKVLNVFRFLFKCSTAVKGSQVRLSTILRSKCVWQE